MSKHAPGGENKSSEKGMTHAHPSAGSKSIKSEEHVGSSGSHGIRFPVHNHPDHSNVRGMK